MLSDIKTISKKELLDIKRHDFTIGDIRKFLKQNEDLKDDAVVLIERIEDIYFNKNNWSVYLEPGDSLYNQDRMNKEMMDEVERRKRGEESEYPKIENPEDYICKIDDSFKDQFIPANCISRHCGEDDLIFIHLHY